VNVLEHKNRFRGLNEILPQSVRSGKKVRVGGLVRKVFGAGDEKKYLF